MFTRILTPHEREIVRKFLRGQHGRDAAIRQLVSRTRKHLNTILEDIALTKKLSEAYEAGNPRRARHGLVTEGNRERTQDP